ncbi:hypothetical protein GSI_14279 [Ganoderma sinense ZZ0214-1]|uniref:Presequence translocated-associated motor subunit PAM17 n=1 Tax=Ganoderma sinense ZZ0214-1 TaxID=1077348 RepID=A0A2G8RSP9_9APHY|nr:hypothetical protein GSI_14279 [Ganoderma sinense ZZ0214-1]
MSTHHIRPLGRTLPGSTRPKLASSARARLQNTVPCRGKATKPSNTSGASQASEAEKDSLPWQEYLSIRKGKRRWETAVTIPTTIAGFVGGISYFGTLEMDPQKPIFNIDPMFVYGAATLGCAGMGYLIGPVLGSSFWRMTHRRAMRLIEKRDKEFHEHIVRNRVDPTRQSATNPVPDYYGEKIGSLNDYRQWLRDQAKFRRKASGFLSED